MSLKIDRAQLEIVIGNDQARKRMREIDEDIKELNKEIRRLKKAGEDTTKQEEGIKKLTLEYDGLIEGIGLASLSMRELGRRRKELNAIINQLPADDPLRERYVKQLGEVNNRIKEVSNSAKDTQKQLEKPLSGKGGFLTVLKGVFAGNLLTKGAMMLADLARKAREFVREGVEMAAAAEGIENAFFRISNRDYLNDLRKQTRGLVSDFTLMQSAVRAENFDIPLTQLGTLLQFAQNRARDTGESVEYLTQSIIDGIGRKSPLILDNLGISVVRIQEEVKKTGDFATAVGKIVEDEMSKAGEVIDTAADAATRKKVAWENLQLAVGNFFVKFKSGWDDFTARFAEGITKLIQGSEDAVKAYDDQIKKVANLEINVGSLASEYDRLSKKASLNEVEQNKINSIMDQLIAIVPEARGEFDEYGNSISINTEKVREYIEAERARIAIMREAALKEAQKDLDEAKRKRDLAAAQVKQGGKAKMVTSGRNVVITSYEIDESTLGEAIKDLSQYGEEYRKAQEKLDQISGAAYEREITKRFEFNQMTKNQLGEWIKDEKNAQDEFITIAKEIYITKSEIDKVVEDGKKGNKTKEADPFKEELDLLKKAQKEELLILKQSLLAKDVTEEEFREISFQKEYAHLLEMKKLYEKFGQDTIDVDMQITDQLIGEVNRKYKLEQDAAKENERELAAIRKDAEDTKAKEAKALADKTEEEAKEAAAKRREMMDGVANEHKEFIDILYDLNIEWLNNFLDEYSDAASAMATMGSNIINTAMNLNRAEEMAVERKYDKMIEAAGKNSRQAAKLEEEKEKKLNEIRAKYADKQFIVTIANVIASTAASAMEAFKAMAGIPVVGPVLGGIAAAAAVAFGASQIAVAKQQRDAAKAGYRSGGYTGSGKDDEEAGVVHRNEFVNTADAVRNPHVKRFLDVFNVAQKDGTIRMLNTSQILERARLDAVAPVRQTVYSAPTPTDDLGHIETLNRLSDTVDRLTEKLEIPIPAYTVIHGPSGSKKRNEMYDRIMKNARLG